MITKTRVPSQPLPPKPLTSGQPSAPKRAAVADLKAAAEKRPVDQAMPKKGSEARRPDLGTVREPKPGPRLPPLTGRAPEQRSGAGQPPPTDAKAALDGLLAKNQVRKEFPEAVLAEVRQLQENPGLDDPALRDLTHLPFITIDNEGSKDLDQAMYIARNEQGGQDVYYALADAAHYIKPGTALFDEACKRGTTFYMPHGCVPMLPRELSEGLVSLNEDVDRRALVFKISVDKEGHTTGSEWFQGKIHSRQQLTYSGVQEYYDHPNGNALAGKDYTETLDLLREFGQTRIGEAASRGVAQFERPEQDVRPADPECKKLVISEHPRIPVEEWNAQVSLLCNAVGGKFLVEQTSPLDGVQGVFKQHPAPPPEKLAAARDQIEALVQTLGLPKELCWKKGESVGEYIARLPKDGPHRRAFLAIQSLIVHTNKGAFFSTQAGPHYGIGADVYSRFSSPMREMAGVLTHHLLLDPPGTISSGMIDQILGTANTSSKTQKEIERESRKIAMSQLFSADLEKPEAERPVRLGTVMSVKPSQIVIELDDPSVEAKIYAMDLGEKFVLGNKGVELKREDGTPAFRMGAEVAVKVAGYDAEMGRWKLVPVAAD